MFMSMRAVLLSLHVFHQRVLYASIRIPAFQLECRHTTRFLLAYLAFLPLAMWSSIHWATIAVAPVVGFLLTGVENVAVMIENPMLTLPMDAYCRGLRKDILAAGAAWAEGSEVCILTTCACCHSPKPQWGPQLIEWRLL